MTQTNNRFFDEIGRLMNDAAGAAQGVKREVDVEQRGEEPAGQDALAQFGIVDRDGHGGLVVTLAHSGHSAGATLCPGGPLAALRTRGRLQFLDGRHRCKSLFSKKLKAASRPVNVPQQASRGAGAADVAAFSPKGAK